MLFIYTVYIYINVCYILKLVCYILNCYIFNYKLIIINFSQLDCFLQEPILKSGICIKIQQAQGFSGEVFFGEATPEQLAELMMKIRQDFGGSRSGFVWVSDSKTP